MIKIYLLAIAILFSSMSYAQVTTTNETSLGSCDGTVNIDSNNILYAFIVDWVSDTTILQQGGYSLTGLCVGNYFVTYLNFSAGVDTLFFSIGTDTVGNSCANFSVAASVINETINSLCDGSATISVTGGTAPFSYSWNNGVTTASLSNLCKGAYLITVTDSNNCSVIDSAIVGSDTTIVDPCINFGISANVVKATGDSLCDGTATITVTGGTTPFTYLWSTGSTTASVTNLCVGQDTVTVTDSNNCSIILSNIFIGSMTNPCAGFSVSSEVAKGTSGDTICDGYVSARKIGGTAPFSYSWNNGDTISDLFPLAALNMDLCKGLNTVTIIDSNNCSISDTFLVELSPCAGFSASIVTTPESDTLLCDGTVNTTVTGGTPPYSYLWEDENYFVIDSIAVLSNLCSGEYFLTVTDALGCVIGDDAFIDPFAGIYPIVGIIDTYAETADSACDGVAYLTISGGVPPYSYLHSNGLNTADVNSLCAGLHNVEITDSLGNTLVLDYLIPTPSKIYTDTTFQGGNILDTIAGKIIKNCTVDYSSIDSVSIISSFSFLNAVIIDWAVYYSNTVEYFSVFYNILGQGGLYSFELNLLCKNKSTSNFLKAIGQVNYTPPTPTGIEILATNNTLNAAVYPLPFTENITVQLEKLGTYQISILDVRGQLMFNKTYNVTKQININLNYLAKGQYILNIQNETSFINKKLIK